MPDKKELSIVTFSSETVVFDGKGDRVVACPTEQEAVEYIRGQEIPVDRQGSESVSYTHLDVYKRQSLRCR